MWFYLVATLVLGALLYKLISKGSNDYWKKLGIREIDISEDVGILDVFLGRKGMAAGDLYAYNKMGSDKFCGIMDMATPMLLVKDMDLLKKILIKDFDHFVDRRQFFHEEDGAFKNIVFSLEGEEWKGVRVAMTHTFTSGKIRKMMGIFNSVSKEWVDEYKRQAKSSPDGSVVIEVMKSINQYTVEVISNAAFGMSAGVIKNPDCTFIKMADQMANMNLKQIIRFGLRFLFPKICHFFKIALFDMESLSYFESILNREVKSRMSGEKKRNDWIQLLIEARKGELKAAGLDELSNFEKEAQISTSSADKKQYLTDEIMTAQCVVFFTAGYFNSSNIITFTLYALALNKDGVQERLREEVNKIVKEDGTVDYDDIGNMFYMDMVVCEILRIVTAAGRLERLCVKDYKDPESGLSIPKGTVIGIPVNGLHNDKKHYDNPDEFDPEHFSPEKKSGRNPYAFIPFGVGPRNCIGMRFAVTEVKAAIAHIVYSFKIERTPNTPTPFHVRPAGIQVAPPRNLQVRLIPIDDGK